MAAQAAIADSDHLARPLARKHCPLLAFRRWLQQEVGVGRAAAAG